MFGVNICPAYALAMLALLGSNSTTTTFSARGSPACPLPNLPRKLVPCLSYIHYSCSRAFFRPQTIIQRIDMALATRPRRHQSLEQRERHLALSCGLRGSVERADAARGHQENDTLPDPSYVSCHRHVRQIKTDLMHLRQAMYLSG